MNPDQPPREPTVALELKADEAQLIFAYRRATPWHQRVLRFIANYFAAGGNGDGEPPGAANIVRLFRNGTD